MSGAKPAIETRLNVSERSVRRAAESWNRKRRVVEKAEWTYDEANPRFVVTSLRRAEVAAWFRYEMSYRAHGEMENRIAECVRSAR